jgi:hypothetical protein
MAIEKTIVDALQDLVDYRFLTLSTIIPAKVTKVNYNKNHLNALPLIRTKLSDDSQQESPELYHVPIFILSAGAGSARITLPVKIGDTVLILYSQRSLGNFYLSNGRDVVDAESATTHGSYPILALPGLFTPTTAVPVDSSNIIVENGSTKLTIAPDGNITADCPTFTINGNLIVTGDGDFNGSSLNHNGTNVGDDHVHSGVQTGGSNTGAPT